MTEQTRETLQELEKLLRHGAEKCLERNPHVDSAYNMHAMANEIALALAAASFVLPD